MTQTIPLLPNRPLTLKPPISAAKSWFVAVLCLAVAAGLGAFLALAILPDLRDDYAVRDSVKTLRRGDIVSGRCTTKIVVTHCGVTLVDRDARQTRSVNYLFVDMHAGDYSTEVVADPARPALLTTDLGLEKLPNRAIVAAALALIVLAIIIGGLLQLRRVLRARRLVQENFSARRMVAVPAKLRHATAGNWTVQDDQGREFRWPITGKASPFLLAPGDRVLAVGPAEPGATPMLFPLDEKLRWIDLTEAERVALQS